MTVRVRFAPSPTGYLHIGGARTALYNWLFARHNKGTFILRIEDTDEVRSTSESVDGILEGMKWLGLDWDEGPNYDLSSKGDYGPYFQMQRKELYTEYAKKLLDEGKAYLCYCSQEELAERREEAKKNGVAPKYDGRCRNITSEQKKKYEAEGRKPVIRFKNDFKGQTKFDDIVRGEVSFENELLDDFVIVKSSGIPVYNFAVTIDDYLMKITHVVRGDDHISNTPRQIMLYKSFGCEIPKFAHIPMILGQDGSRLSKRHGATSVTSYRDEGYLPEALLNYLSLLGWATEDSQQLFTQEELIQKFTLERCSSSAAIFDLQKLIWMNGEYIRKKTIDEFYEIEKPILVKAGLIKENLSIDEENFVKKVLALEQEKTKLTIDVPKLVDFMLKDDFEYDQKAIEKILKKENAKQILNDMQERIQNLEDFTSDNLEKLTRDYALEKNIKTGEIFHPVRVATSGRTIGPSLFHYMEVLGKEKVIARIKNTKKLIG
jgi:nondiscriminating glutamyl-tRNA synthetase